MQQWFCHFGQQTYGPYDFDGLLQLAAAGQLPPDGLVRYGEQQWVPAMSMPQLAAILHGRSGAVPAMPTPVRVQPGARPASGHAAAVTPAMVRPVGNVPPVPPPVHAAVPTGIPVGIPVGQVVAPPANQFAPPAFPQVNVHAGVTAGATVSKNQLAAGGKRGKNDPGKMLVYGLGGCVAACAVVGLLVVFNNSGTKPKEVAKNELAAENTPADDEGMVPEESTPAVSPVVKPTATKSVNATTAAPVAGPTAEQRLLKEYQGKSKDTTTVRVGKFSGVGKIEFMSAWLASDATGTRVKKTAAAVPAAGEKADPPANEPSADSKEPEENTTPTLRTEAAADAAPAVAKYIFVEMQITNDSAQPLKYRSWNGVASDTKALLGCNESQILAVASALRTGQRIVTELGFTESDILAAVSPTETPLAKRLTKGVDILPKQSLRDILVFTVPTGDFTQLQLLLPLPAIAGLGNKYSSWQIPKDSLYLEPAPSSAAGQPVAVSNPGGQASPATGGPPVSKERKEFDDLLKDIGKVNAPDRPGRPVTDAKPDTKPAEGEKPEEMKKDEPKKDEPKKEGPPSIKDLDKAIKDVNENKPKPEPEKKPEEK